MTDNDNNTEVTPEGMKMQALLERVAQLTADYENKIADLRVALTIVSDERDQLVAQARQNEAQEQPSE